MKPAPRPLLLVLLLCAAPAASRADSTLPVPTSSLQPLHALSLYGRGLFATTDVLSVGLPVSQPVISGGFGGSYTYRKGTLDIVTSLDLSFLSPHDGNFLGAGKDPAVDTHYAHFDGLNLLSIDVAFYYVKDLHPRLAFVIGGGIGLGLLLGEVWVVNNRGPGCTTATASDPTKCHPTADASLYAAHGDPAPTYTNAAGKMVALTGDISPSDPDFQRKLDGLRDSQAVCVSSKGKDCRDTAEHPYWHRAVEKPPVMVVINVQLGFKFKIHRHFNFNLMGGFRDGFVVGGGPEYVF